MDKGAEQLATIAALRREAKSSDALAPSYVRVASRLRADALLSIADDNDFVKAARKGSLSSAAVCLGFALHSNDDGRSRLDGDDERVQWHGLRYLLSPATPTREACEKLFACRPLGGGEEVTRLNWHLLTQLASLPANRAFSLKTAADLVIADALVLGAQQPKRLFAEELLTVLAACLGALGFATPLGNRFAIESTSLGETLQAIADQQQPRASESTPAELIRDGSDLVVVAENSVPLSRLVPLAPFAAISFVSDCVVLRLTPNALRSHGSTVPRAVAFACHALPTTGSTGIART